MTDLTFILQKGEKIIKDASSLQYSGVAHLTFGSGAGIGSGIGGNSGIGSVLHSSKQIKREGSIWDAKSTHIYLTNKRIIFCNAKMAFFSRKEKSIGTPFSEISLKNIKGLNKNSKLLNPAIDLAITGENGGIDNIKFWFLGTEKQRGKERDEFLAAIQKQLK